MPFAASPNQTQERKIYQLFKEGYTAREISDHLGIEYEGILLYDPSYKKPEPEVVKEQVEKRAVEAAKFTARKKKKKARKKLATHSDMGEVAN